MKIIKVKAIYKNSTLLRIAKKHTIDAINQDTTKIGFNDYGSFFACEIVKDMNKLFYWLSDLKGQIKYAKSQGDAERIERLRAGAYNYIVKFNNNRLEPVKLVAVV